MLAPAVSHGPSRDGRMVPYLDLVPAAEPHATPLVALPGLVDGLAPVTLESTRTAMRPPPPDFGGFRVLVASYPVPLPDPATTEALADDLATFLRATVDRPAIIAGHSMGGMVAQHLAAAHPELVRGLILSSTLPCADEAFRARLRRWESLLEAGDWGGFHRDALDAAYTGSDLLRRRIVLRLSPVHEPPAELVARHLALSAACRGHDATTVVDRIEAPTMVLVGDADPLTRPAGARELARRIPGARFEALRRVSHGFPEQAFGRYRELLVDFVEAVA